VASVPQTPRAGSSTAAVAAIVGGVQPPSDPLASPCIRTCCLDDDDVCMGCGRSLAEIVSWGTASDDEKREILAHSRRRAAEKRSRLGSD
jgi:predicted Fe-S protein YdhL (DUF1289 family)